MTESPGQRLHRYRIESGLSIKELCRLLDSSLSMFYYVETGKRGFPTRWFDRLPPKVTVPILEEIIAAKYAEITELERRLGAMKKSRQGETTGTQIRGSQGFVDDFSYSDLDRV